MLHKKNLGILWASLVLASCGSGESQAPLPSDETIVGLAAVESVEVVVTLSTPPFYQVNVKGFLPDPCHELQDPVIELINRTYEVRLETLRPAALICPQVVELFETSFTLPTQEVPPIFDRVIVNGVEDDQDLEPVVPIVSLPQSSIPETANF